MNGLFQKPTPLSDVGNMPLLSLSLSSFCFLVNFVILLFLLKAPLMAVGVQEVVLQSTTHTTTILEASIPRVALDLMK